MVTQWCFIQEDRIVGPYTVAQIQVMVESGQLSPTTSLYPYNPQLQHGVAAEKVAAAAAAPDWLDDVRQVVDSGPNRPERSHDKPDWLANVSKAEDLAARPQAVERPPAAPLPPAPTPPATLPIALTQPIPSVPNSFDGASIDVELIPIPEPPPQPAEPTTLRKRAKRTSLAAPLLAAPPLAVASSLASAPIAQPASLPEAIDRAQARLNAWFEDEANRNEILQGDRQSLTCQPAFAAILSLLTPFGPAAVENFWKYAQFLLDMRRKYLNALRPNALAERPAAPR